MAEKILIISPVPLFPGHAGNCERIRAICSELMNRGYLLDLFYTGFQEELAKEHISFFNGNILEHKLPGDKVSWAKHPLFRCKEIIQGIQIKVSRFFRQRTEESESARFNRSLKEYRNLGKWILLNNQVSGDAYKAVIVNYAPYSFYFDLFDKKTIRIIDTHDRLTDRFKLFSENNTTPVNWHSLRQADEQKALEKGDVIWAITNDERNYFKTLVPGTSKDVYTLRHLMPYNPTETVEQVNTIIMIGSSNRLNIEGLTWFLEQVWKKVKHYELELRFIVAGSICEAVDVSILGKNVELYGRFESDEEIYSKGELFINPMQEGTGLKIKTFEALANGKYVLSTTAGASGLDEVIGNGLTCSNDPAEWIKQIKNYFKNDVEDRTETNAKEIISNIYLDNLDILTRSLKNK